MNTNSDYYKVYQEKEVEQLVEDIDNQVNDPEEKLVTTFVNWFSFKDQAKGEFEKIKQKSYCLANLKLDVEFNDETFKELTNLFQNELDPLKKAALEKSLSSSYEEYIKSCYKLAKMKRNIVKSIKVFGEKHLCFSRSDLQSLNLKIRYFSTIVDKYHKEIKTKPSSLGAKEIVSTLSLSLSSSTSDFFKEQIITIRNIFDDGQHYQKDLKNFHKLKKSLSLSQNPELENSLKQIENLYQKAGNCLSKLKAVSLQLKKNKDQQKIKNLMYEKLTLEYSFKKQNLTLLSKQLTVIETFAQTASNEQRTPLEENLLPIVEVSLIHLKFLSKELKKIKKVIKENSYEKTIHSIETRTWSSTRWGQLLLTESVGNFQKKDFNRLIKSYYSLIEYYETGRRSLRKHLNPLLGNGFEKQIEGLKQSKSELKEILSSSELNSSNLNSSDLNKAKWTLYQTLLIRLIEVRGDKQRLKNETKGSILTEKIIDADIKELDLAYEQIIQKFSSIAFEKSNIFDHLKKTNPFTLVYKGNQRLSIDELQVRKHYADLGYSMQAEVGKWLQEVMIKEGETWQAAFSREIQGFLNWAESHPLTASKLASDVALTCAIIGDADLLKKLKTTMEARAYSVAFLIPWGHTSVEITDVKQELKYRALADVCHFLPFITAFIKGSTANTGFKDKVLSIAGELAKATFTQQIVKAVPVEYDSLFIATLNIVRGNDFRAILETERNLELLRISGDVKKFLTHPISALSSVKKATTIWWQSVLESKGKEKLLRTTLQVALPVLSTLGFGAVIILSVLTGPVSLFAFLVTALSLAALNRQVFVTCNQLVNVRYDTHRTIKERIEKQELAGRHRSLELIIKDKYGSKIKKETDLYIKDLVKQGAVPFVFKTKTPECLTSYSSFIKSLSQEKSKAMQASLNSEDAKALDSQIKNTAYYTQLYTNQIDIEVMRKEIQTKLREEQIRNYDENLIPFLTEEILFKVLNSLLVEWLSPHLEEAFIKRCVEMIDFSVPSHDREEKFLEDIKKKYPNFIKSDNTVDLKRYLKNKLMADPSYIQGSRDGLYKATDIDRLVDQLQEEGEKAIELHKMN